MAKINKKTKMKSKMKTKIKNKNRRLFYRSIKLTMYYALYDEVLDHLLMYHDKINTRYNIDNQIANKIKKIKYNKDWNSSYIEGTVTIEFGGAHDDLIQLGSGTYPHDDLIQCIFNYLKNSRQEYIWIKDPLIV
jgi:hypothetical protein